MLPQGYQKNSFIFKMQTINDLPSDCILQIVLRLPVPDLPKAILVSKKFSSVLSSEIFKSALFFQKYGADYWGEYAGIHPYYKVAKIIKR